MKNTCGPKCKAIFAVPDNVDSYLAWNQPCALFSTPVPAKFHRDARRISWHELFHAQEANADDGHARWRFVLWRRPWRFFDVWPTGCRVLLHELRDKAQSTLMPELRLEHEKNRLMHSHTLILTEEPELFCILGPRTAAYDRNSSSYRHRHVWPLEIEKADGPEGLEDPGSRIILLNLQK